MAEYTPLDLSNIKPSKSRSESDLDKEIAAIIKTLKDTKSADWKDRIKAMESIQSIVITDRCKSLSNFLKHVDKLFMPLNAQLMDLRSAITREA